MRAVLLLAFLVLFCCGRALAQGAPSAAPEASAAAAGICISSATAGDAAVVASTSPVILSTAAPCVPSRSLPSRALGLVYSGECGLLFNRCVFNNTLAGADRMQELLSRRFMAATETLDRTLSFSSVPANGNLSSLLVSVNYQKSAHSDSTNADVSLTLKLPRTSGRLNLIAEHVGENLLPGENQQMQSIEQTQEHLAMGQQAAGSFVGLRYIIGATKALQEHIDTGIHARVESNHSPYLILSPFARSSMSYSARAGNLDGRLFGQMMWDSGNWLSATGGLYLKYPLLAQLAAASSSNIVWQSDSANANLYQTISFPFVLDDRDVLTPALQCQGQTSPAISAAMYSISVSLRHRLYKKWLFAEVTPTVNYPRSGAFFPVFVQWVRLDILFGAGS
jgi:hypothetical protein